MKRVYLSAIVFFLLSSVVFAGKIQETAMAEKGQNITGKELLDKINLRKAADKDYALGYITGVYCVYSNQGIVPDLPTSEKIVKIVRKYFEENKEKLNRPAVELLKEAFEKAFPGKKK